MKRLVATIGALGLAASACGGNGSSEPLRMNQIQAVGTHNSYHVGPTPDQIATLERLVTELNLDLGDPKSLGYTHAPLEDQLARGMRSFEIDLGLPAELRGDITVAHIPRIDEGTHCPTLAACLAVFSQWSNSHPRHVPLTILVELKGQELNAAQADFLDAAIRQAVPADKLLEPDEVRGNAKTLREAVTTAGWPTLDEVRGQFMFVMINHGDVATGYRDGHPQLDGRAIFSSDGLSDDGTIRDDGAVFLIDDAERIETINKVVAAGHIVRTRADGPLEPSPTGSKLALKSGAQVISTDYPPGEEAPDGYVVKLPEGAARCNPISAPPSCKGPVEGDLSQE